MKNFIIVLCVILAVGITLGIIGIIVTATRGDVSDVDKTVKTESYASGEKLSVKCFTDDVKVVVGNGDEVVFEYYEYKNHKPEITHENGVISFRLGKKFSFFDINRIFHKNAKLTVTLPKEFNGKLEIQDGTSDIDADLSSLTIEKLIFDVSTGSIAVKNAKVGGDISLTCTTGAVLACNLEINGSLHAEESTGAIELADITATGNVEVKSTTGTVKLANVTAENITTTCTTGKTNVDVDCKALSIKSTTGETSFKVKNATNIKVTATTGDIDGTIGGSMWDYDIDYSVTTGKCNLPRIDKNLGKTIYISTTTGDIDVTFTD